MITKICKECGVKYNVDKSRIDTSNFCSRKCMGKWYSENLRYEKHSCWKGGGIIKVCKQCGRNYKVRQSAKDMSRFCSRKCQGKWQSENMRGEKHPSWKGGNIKKNCEQCGDEFEIKPSETGRRFCSLKCRDNYHSEHIRGEKCPLWKGGKIIKICDQCGLGFEVHPSDEDRRHFCSRECYSKWLSNQRGDKAIAWKGGVSFEPYCSKFNEKFKELIRDKFNRTCFLCQTTEQEIMDLRRLQGKRAYKLSIHHVNYNKDCLCDDSICEFVPLCQSCHAKTSNGDREYWENLIMEKLNATLQ